MKKILSTFMSIILCFIAMPVFADAIKISGAELSASAGDTLDFSIDISGNTGVVAFRLEVIWDKDALSLKDNPVKYGDGFKNATVAENKKINGSLYIAWIQTTNVIQNGNLVTLSFDVLKDAYSGDYPIEINISGFTDENGIISEPVCKDGLIKISGQKKPDDNSTLNQDNNSSSNQDSNPSSGSIISTKPSGIPQSSALNNIANTEIAPETFTDINKDDYYYESVLWAVNNDITNGISADKFSPDEHCTRAQAVTFLWRFADSPDYADSFNSFLDISKTDYFYLPVIWAVDNKITLGTDENMFSPDKTVTRAQFITFLWRYSGSPESSHAITFDDVSKNSYYYQAVCWATDIGITTGTSVNTFSPDSPCTRAQIVTMLHRLSK